MSKITHSKESYTEAGKIIYADKDLVKTENKLKDESDLYEKGKKFLMEKYAELEKLREEVEVLLAKSEDFSGKVYEEMENVLHYPNVSKAWIELENKKPVLHVETLPMSATASNGDEFFLSAMEFTVCLSSGAVSVRHLPKSTPANPNRVHPHSGGCSPYDWCNICMGNIDSTLMDLTHSSELYAIVALMMEYWQSANVTDSWGKYYKKFPVNEEEYEKMIAGKSSGNVDAPLDDDDDEDYDDE